MTPSELQALLDQMAEIDVTPDERIDPRIKPETAWECGFAVCRDRIGEVVRHFVDHHSKPARPGEEN
jgi:hypothetical protein